MQKILSLFIAVACLLPAAAFAQEGGVLPPAPEQIVSLPELRFEPSSLSAENFLAADVIAEQISGKVSRNSPVLIASMVQLNDLRHSSVLGRLVMQQISSRISQFGYRVLESRLKKEYTVVPKEGEFILSRDVSELMQKEYNAQVVLVGSYVPTPYRVYVSIRMLRISDGVVLAAHEYTLKNRREFAVLLREDRGEQRDLWAMYNKRPNAFSVRERRAKAKKTAALSGPAAINPQVDGQVDMTNFPVLSAPASSADLKR
ncbi:FlgO family outer membrane protein [Halodesulfovibrio spirochaetisodalis]|uniref:FlgO family outer membrane protein n=1 Tax=Halodesulfovibrio spirochaetisodalis TaxID=1560234 RepID=UPI000836B3E9|nr:FlgO family outer membrane protein [Halodesulfovibrio spirochaetisodalis]